MRRGRSIRRQETGVRTKDENQNTEDSERQNSEAEQKPLQESTHSWMEEIEERIRLKAGNQPVHPSLKLKNKTHKEENKEAKYGTGMTIEEVERVMKEFRNN